MIILTDCDGVLLNWAQSYHWWMHRKGYRPVDATAYAMDVHYGIKRSESQELCKTFCESAAIKLREKNLDRIFGEGVFERVVCLPCGEDKDEALERYRDSNFIWIEDKTENAELGAKMGLNTFLINHIYNEGHDISDGVTRVNNWKDLYDYIGGK